MVAVTGSVLEVVPGQGTVAMGGVSVTVTDHLGMEYVTNTSASGVWSVDVPAGDEVVVDVDEGSLPFEQPYAGKATSGDGDAVDTKHGGAISEVVTKYLRYSKVTGRVVEEIGATKQMRPLYNIMVHVEDALSQVWHVRTNDKGVWHLTLPPGTAKATVAPEKGTTLPICKAVGGLVGTVEVLWDTAAEFDSVRYDCTDDCLASNPCDAATEVCIDEVFKGRCMDKEDYYNTSSTSSSTTTSSATSTSTTTSSSSYVTTSTTNTTTVTTSTVTTSTATTSTETTTTTYTNTTVAFGPEAPPPMGTYSITFPGLDYDATDFVRLEATIRGALAKTPGVGAGDLRAATIAFRRGSVVADVTAPAAVIAVLKAEANTAAVVGAVAAAFPSNPASTPVVTTVAGGAGAASSGMPTETLVGIVFAAAIVLIAVVLAVVITRRGQRAQDKSADTALDTYGPQHVEDFAMARLSSGGDFGDTSGSAFYPGATAAATTTAETQWTAGPLLPAPGADEVSLASSKAAEDNAQYNQGIEEYLAVASAGGVYHGTRAGARAHTHTHTPCPPSFSFPLPRHVPSLASM